MAAPQPFSQSAGSGVTLYYVPPPNMPPNVFSSFWHSYLVARSPYAQKAYAQILAAQDPKSQYAALADIAKARQAMEAEEQKNYRAELSSSTQLAGQEHADYRSRVAYESATKSAAISGNSRITAAKIGLESDRIKADELQEPAQRILGDYRTQMEGAQLDLRDAVDRGDDAAITAAEQAIQETIATARANADNLPPAQQISLSNHIDSLPMVVSDPGVQDAIRTAVRGAFNGSERRPAEEFGGVGAAGAGSLEPPPRTGPDVKVSTSRSIAERITPSSSSAVPPGSSSTERRESPTTAPARLEGTSAGTHDEAGEKEGYEEHKREGAAGEAAESQNSQPNTGGSSSEIDRIQSQVSGQKAPDIAAFNFYKPGFGVYGDQGAARKAPESRSRSMAQDIATRAQRPAKEPSTTESKGKSPDAPKGQRKGGKGIPVEQWAEGTFGGDQGKVDQPSSLSLPGGKTMAEMQAAKRKPAAKPPAEQPKPGGGAGDVKAAEARTAREQVVPGGGAGDVKAAEAKEDRMVPRGQNVQTKPSKMNSVADAVMRVYDATQPVRDVASRVDRASTVIPGEYPSLEDNAGLADSMLRATGSDLATEIANRIAARKQKPAAGTTAQK